MEENRAPMYWIIAAIYYVPVLLGVLFGWFGAAVALIFLFIPLLAASVYRASAFRELITYLETHHPESWGSIAGRWLYRRGFEVDKFVFSKELNEDPDLKALKKNLRHLCLVTYFMGAALIIYVVFFIHGRP